MGTEMNQMPSVATAKKLRLEKRSSFVPKYDSETAGKGSPAAPSSREMRTTLNWANVRMVPAIYHMSSPEKLNEKVMNSEMASAQNTTMTAAWADVPRSLRSQ